MRSPDRNYAIVCTEFDHSEQILQLLKTAVNVSNYDGAAHDGRSVKQKMYRVGGPV